jgi:uncharacterized membrane protein YeaQ/YmgE (transglycosylase-associated protein family)
MARQFDSPLVILALLVLNCALGLGQSQQPAPVPNPASPETNPPGQPSPGSISGTLVDQSGAVVAGALVKLSGESPSPGAQSISSADGQFTFAGVAPGPFHLTITAAGFATQAFSGTLHSAENYVVPQIALAVATAVTDVEVGVSRIEVAEEQIQVEEKQRVLGVFPNFYVSYDPHAVPLSSKQKFELAWRSVIDPVTFLLVGGAAGVEQANNTFSGYGQGAQGYAKRFGAGYADTVSGTFIGSAILPSLLKQDPRYFYKGTGSTSSRTLYALANAVICKGDNGQWQANYSIIVGSLAAGGISNLYYPAKDRNGAGLTFANAAIGIGGSAVANLLQEFVVRKFTPKLPEIASAKP